MVAESSDAGALAHLMLKDVLAGQLCLTMDLPRAATILDVGTGTGHWAREMATDRPDARVYGIDVRPVASVNESPSNVIFETVDVMEGIPFNTGTFDLVHSRLLCGGITDWHQYLGNLLRLVKKGGVVECVEVELELHSSSGRSIPNALATWNHLVSSFLTTSGLDGSCASQLAARLRSQGFSDVSEDIRQVPLCTTGPVTHRSEQLQQSLSLQLFEHMVEWLVSHMQESASTDKGTVQELAQQVRIIARSESDQYYCRWHFCRATK